MLKPKPLQPGDRIGVIAPAGPTTPERVAQAKTAVEALGFRVELGPSCHERHGYLAGSDRVRADDVNRMFQNPEIQGIICLRGGYGTPKILDKLDYDLIRNNPKVFVGYSDITALHLAMNQLCGLVTFHGPMASSDMADGLDDFSKASLLDAITCPELMGMIVNPEGEEIQTVVTGEARGPIIGGNLSLVAATMGTPYEIDTRGKLLFLEDIGEEPYRVDRMLTQLALGGKLREAAGIILGDWNHCEPENPEKSLSLTQVFNEIILPAGKPAICNLKAGHCAPKVTLPFGVEAHLDATAGTLIITESSLS